MKALTRMSKCSLTALLISFALISGCSEDPVPPPTPTCIAASDSIVGWWPLDQLGSTAEELVDGNQGDYVGNPLEAEGKVGGALRFDGVNDVIEISDPGDWVYDITGDITLEAWIKRDSDQDPAHHRIFVGKFGAYFLGYRNGRIFSVIEQVFIFDGVTPLDIGKWYHVAVTYDVTARAAKIYLNGEVDATFLTAGQNVPVSDGSIFIGGNPGFPQYFDGYIDEVSIYKSALSTSEIREIFNRGSLGKCK